MYYERKILVTFFYKNRLTEIFKLTIYEEYMLSDCEKPFCTYDWRFIMKQDLWTDFYFSIGYNK